MTKTSLNKTPSLFAVVRAFRQFFDIANTPFLSAGFQVSDNFFNFLPPAHISSYLVVVKFPSDFACSTPRHLAY